jgi:BMFP domain-containing protein YqiC
VSVVRFPEERARILPKGRDAAFEVIANWLIEAISEIAELRARVDELEAGRSPRRSDMGEVGAEEDHYA